MTEAAQPDKLQLREKRIVARRYFTVSLSDVVLPEGEPYRCWKCGYRVTTVFNEPKTQVQIQLNPNDVPHQRLTEHLCKNCNIVFLFI